MFGEVEDAYSGRSLTFEEEKAKARAAAKRTTSDVADDVVITTPDSDVTTKTAKDEQATEETAPTKTATAPCPVGEAVRC